MKKSMGLIMVVACVLPIGLAYILAARGISAGWLLFLLCPLMHVFMMRGHHHGQHDHSEPVSSQSKKIEEE